VPKDTIFIVVRCLGWEVTVEIKQGTRTHNYNTNIRELKRLSPNSGGSISEHPFYGDLGSNESRVKSYTSHHNPQLPLASSNCRQDTEGTVTGGFRSG